MDLIIDKANILSLLSSEDYDAIFECTRLIKRGIHLCLNFNKDEVDIDSPEGNKIMMWLSNLAHGRKSPLPIWHPSVKSDHIKSNFVTNLSANQKRCVFLLDNQEVIPKIQEKGAILIGCVGQEVELLLSLSLEDTEISTSKISSWIDYCPALPLTDIIISDNHFFKNSYIYSQNKDELISGLTQVVNQSPVNCVIIYKINEVDNSLNLIDEVDSLKKSIKKITGSSKS